MDYTIQGKDYTADKLAAHLQEAANAQDDGYDWTVEWNGTRFIFTPHPRMLSLEFKV